MIYPLLPLYVVSVLGTSKTQLGAMEGGAVFLVAIMSAFAGIQSDRNGRSGGHGPRDARGAALGMFYGLTGLTTFVSSLLVGIVWVRFGPTQAFLVGVCFALLAIFGIFVFRLPSLTAQKRL